MAEFSKESLEELKQKFSKELEGISDLNELKDLFATEIARRDKLILELQKQNEIILRSTFKNKKDELEMK